MTFRYSDKNLHTHTHTHTHIYTKEGALTQCTSRWVLFTEYTLLLKKIFPAALSQWVFVSLIMISAWQQHPLSQKTQGYFLPGHVAMNRNFRKFWNDLINGDVIFNVHLQSSTHLFPSRATWEKKQGNRWSCYKWKGKEGRTEEENEKVRDRWKSSCWWILPGHGKEGVEMNLPWKTTVFTPLSSRMCGAPAPCQASSRCWGAAAKPWQACPVQPEQPINTQVNAHWQTALGAQGRKICRMPGAYTTGRADLDWQVVQGHPQLVTFALEKHWEPMEDHILFFFFFFVFWRPHLQHMEVPRLGVQSEL